MGSRRASPRVISLDTLVLELLIEAFALFTSASKTSSRLLLSDM